jgi:autotransporter-associated beta strand protein
MYMQSLKSTAPQNDRKRRNSFAATLRRSSFVGLAALSASVSHQALAQRLVSTDPDFWRTPEYRADWGLEAIRAADAYAAGYTGLGVTVGVVDSGLDSAHPEFADGRVKPLTLTGSYGSDWFYLMDAYGNPESDSPSWSILKKGQAYTVPGTYNPLYNDPHGTHVSGTIAAARDGNGMHGVGFDATAYVTNTASIDSSRHGANIDYSYFKNAYETLALAGVRAINTSWGDPPVQDEYNTTAGLIRAYATFSGQKNVLDAMDEVTQKYGVIQVVIAGNTSYSNSDIRASLPYFRPDLESRWIAVGAAEQSNHLDYSPNSLFLPSYTNKAGVDKYWYVVAPGSGVFSAVPPHTQNAPWDPATWNVDPDNPTGYTAISGTSMAAPHATGALALLMQRFPYMTNEQTRDVLLTTAYHRDAVVGMPDANPNAPNAIWGWGVIDLNKALKGPGQFLGRVAANLPTGTRDTWSNDISEDALTQRKQENDVEAAAWTARKATRDPQMQLPALQASMTDAWSAINDLADALVDGRDQVVLPALQSVADNPLDDKLLATFIGQNQLGAYWPFRDPADRTQIGPRLSSYLGGLSGADYEQAAEAAVIDWQTEVQVATARIASFAKIPTQGSLIKLGGGTLALTGTNTYSGGTTLACGTLSVSRDVNLGAAGAPLIFDGGILQITETAFSATARPITWGLAGGGLDIADPANTFTLEQSLTGPGGLTKAGSGTLALAGTNTYTGGTTIAAGTLQVRGGQAIGDLSAVTLAPGATLALADSETIGSLAGQGRVALGAARLTAGGDNMSTTFAGTIDGTGGLTKAGSGTLTLAGTNTYTGGTTIAAGTLQVGAGGSLASDVANAGILAFNRADNLTFAGAVSGTGDLIQRGPSTLTLTAAHSFTGLTTVAAGGLSLTATASLVSPVTTLAGTTLTNAGTLSGGLTNAGTTTTSGTIAGGVTNTGTLTAVAGALQGPVHNAGQVSIAGPVTGDAGFANTAGGSLIVTGRYSLAGTLSNVGTVAVAGGGYLRAGHVANAGLLTVAAAASVVDDLTNTGRLVNAGAYTANAVNAPGGTLINTGRFTTVSGPFANAGTLVTTGTLTGGLTNTGLVQASGTLTGVVMNAPGATLALTGPTTGITRLTNDGAFDLGTSALSVGALEGSSREALLRNGQLTVGAHGSSTTYAGRIVDGVTPTSLTKLGAGTLALSGTNTYSGGTTIATGTLLANGGQAIGDRSAVLIGAGATLLLADSERIGSLAGQGRVALESARLTAGDDTSTTFAGTLDGTGSLTKAGVGTLTLTGTNTYTGTTTIAAGTLEIGASGTTGSFVSDVANAGTLAFNRANAVTFAGAISGPGDLIQRGPGTLTLTAAHSFTGQTIVAAGGLSLTATASLVSPVATLAGTTLTNAGTLAGGLNNAGTALTRGTVAGGITNTGVLTATAGALDGAIRNTGQVAITGPVSSDAGFANTAGGSLTVSGRYALAGALDNAGTIALVDGGRLNAGRVANAGLLTVAAQASVVDDLVNTGRLVNAGSYTADAVNAPGGTLINTGRFTTVSVPFANAGTLVTTGTLTGGLTNTGGVQAAGVLAGPVSNAPGALIALTGTTTGITRLTNDGAFDLGGTALTVGSLTGSAASATLGNGQLTVGTDGSSTDYAGQIVDGLSPTSLIKVGAGTLTLSGRNSFSGPIRVQGGDLAVTGALPNAALSLSAGSRLIGDGWFGSLSLGAGSVLSPGRAPGFLGQIRVAGNLTFSRGSVYRVDATPDGGSDRIAVGGTATVAGARVEAVAGAGTWAPRTRYTILSAAGGVQGRFDGVSSNFAFLTPFLSYEPGAVTLTLARNDLDFAAVAQTRNQRAAATAVQAGAVGSALYDAAAKLSAGQARAAFAGMAGDGHASLASTAFATASLTRETVLDRLRWGGGSDRRDDGTLPATDTAARSGPLAEPVKVPARMFDPLVVRLWGQGLGSLGHVQADGNAAALSRQTAGFVMGVDARLDMLGVAGLRLGVVGGHVETKLASPGQVQTGTLESTFGGVYGSLEAGPAVLRFGALAADEPARLRRVVAFPGLTDTPTARTSGHSIQGFAEVGYRITLGTGAVLEPFVGAGAVALGRDRFAEQGGAAALTGAPHGSLLPTAIAGVRAEAQLDAEAAQPVFVHALAGYRRTFGDVVPDAVLAFRGTGARFVSVGLPIDRDALVAEAGLSMLLTPAASLGVSYTGQIGARAQDHAAKGIFTYRF